MNPVALDRRLHDDRDAGEHRNTVCPNYDACLDRAIVHAWTSFSCRACSLFHVRPDEIVASATAQREPAFDEESESQVKRRARDRLRDRRKKLPVVATS